MDDQLLQRSAASQAASRYGAYCIGRMAASASTDASAAFTLPDNEDDNGSMSNGSDGGNESLASYYDLSHHLDSDRTTFLNSSERVVGEPETQTFDALRSEFTEQYMPQDSDSDSTCPALCNSRALSSALCEESAQKDSDGEILSTGKEPFAKQMHADLASQMNELIHPVDNVDVESIVQQAGTNPASSAFDTMFSEQRTPTNAENLHAVLRASMTEVTYADSRESGDKDAEKDRKETQQARKLDLVSLAGAAAIEDATTSAAGTILTSDDVKLPQMKEISKAVLDQMERMRNDTQRNSVSMSIDLPDGNSIPLRLRWNGNHVRATFGNSSMTTRNEIENGWASLRMRAGNSGMMLEEPGFDETLAPVEPVNSNA